MIENWERVQSLFLRALELRPEERVRFLDSACADNKELRHQVESLLAHDSDGEQIAEALLGTAQSFLESVAITPGTRMGDYEILKLIGSGGMGEVYQARDVLLARDVAIKVLPAFLTSDPARLWRFEQEARATAALNHPNIVAVYQMGFYGNAPYLVSEFLEGNTLRELVKRSPLQPRDVVEYGIQIARGLAAAHGKGITHRDLKPENLLVTKEGHLKILDFGLAKLSQPLGPGQAGSATEAGLVMGTVGYMSPEQVRGQAVDYRSDFFAFGAILYEMLSGQPAFNKASAAETISAILNENPPSISQILPNIPPALERVVGRCLEKNPEQRFQSASDLTSGLEAVSTIPALPSFQEEQRSSSSPGRLRYEMSAKAYFRPWSAILALVSCGLLVMLLYRYRPTMPTPKVSRIVQLTKSGGVWRGEPLYNDGPRIYYQSIGPLAAGWQLRQVLLNGDEDTPSNIPLGQFAIRGLSADDTEFVAISHKGQSTVWRIPVAGGSPRRVGDLIADDIAWSHDGNYFAYSQGNRLFLARADGTSSRLLLAAPEGGARVDHVRWSPDDRRLRFTRIIVGDLGSLVHPTKQALWEIGVDGRDLHELRFNWPGDAIECCGDWTPDGHYYVFESDREGISNLWALEEKSDWWRRPNPHPLQLTFGPMNYYQPSSSRNGKSIFAIGAQPSGELVRYDAGRRDFVPFLGGRSLAHLSYSRDGQWLAYVTYPEGTLWKVRTDGTGEVQLTFPPLQVGAPCWSADGKRIAFHAVQSGQPWRNFVISADGGNPEPFPPEPLSQTSPDWMPGRDALIFSRDYRGENPALYIFDRQSGRSEKIPGTDGLYGPSWSPDGRYLSAVDAATDELLLVDLNSGKRTQITGPAAWPTWSADSRYIYFLRWGVNWVSRVRVPDGREEKFLEVPFRVAPWPFKLAPDGSIIMLREHGRYDIYALSLSAP
jgi:serine/threonine protein kinase/dipeptidyl aminopeptidase/acylaminoacyl peptidase